MGRGNKQTESRSKYNSPKVIVHMYGNPCCKICVFYYDDYSVAVVRFSSNEYTVSENDQNVQIGVQLLTLTERSIVVTLTIEPGSAQCK